MHTPMTSRCEWLCRLYTQQNAACNIPPGKKPYVDHDLVLMHFGNENSHAKVGSIQPRTFYFTLLHPIKSSTSAYSSWIYSWKHVQGVNKPKATKSLWNVKSYHLYLSIICQKIAELLYCPLSHKRHCNSSTSVYGSNERWCHTWCFARNV